MSIAPAILNLNGAKGHAAPIRRGDTYSHTITCEDGSGNPIDKSAPIEWLCQLRTKPRSGDIVATFTVTVSGAFNNLVTFSLDKDETAAIPRGQYHFDLQELTPGSPDVVITRVAGLANVDMDVSRAA